MDRPIILNAAMVRAVLSGQKTQTRRPIKPQPPTECSIHYMLGAESWLSRDQQNPLSHYWEAWWGESFLNRPKGHLCGGHKVRSPFGQTGDRLWVRETWDWRDWQSMANRKVRIAYAADGAQVDTIAPCDWNPVVYNAARWHPSIHMPRWASRITLPLVSVRVERVQDISEKDAWAEGYGAYWQKRVKEAGADGPLGYPNARGWFAMLWNELYGTWAQNPWVWVLEWSKAEVK